MKISVIQLKRLIKEALLQETTCPSCNNPDAYVGFTSVECPNKECQHFEPSMVKAKKTSTKIIIDPKNQTTKELVDNVKNLLMHHGHPGVVAYERWGRDNNWIVSSDHSLVPNPNDPNTEIGWSLTVTGNDIIGVEPGIDINYQTNNDSYKISVDNLDDLVDGIIEAEHRMSNEGLLI